MHNNDKARQALQALLVRLDFITQSISDRFPVYSPADTDNWYTSSGGSWLGGYWPALWWLRAKIKFQQGLSVDQELKTASTLSLRLKAKLNINSAYLSSIFYYGAGLGNIWFDLKEQNNLAITAANKLSESFNEDIKCVPLGIEFGGGKTGSMKLAVDYFAPLIQLLKYSGSDKHIKLAKNHVDTFITYSMENNSSCISEIEYQNGIYNAKDKAGDWSRGQAWALLGLVRAAEVFANLNGQTNYRNAASKLFTYWEQTRGNAIPISRLSGSKTEKQYDASAIVIISVALLSLAKLFPENHPLAKQFYQSALEKITSVINSRYFILNSDDISKEGLFWGGHYQTREGDQLVESPWGTFYLAGALASILGYIEVKHL